MLKALALIVAVVITFIYWQVHPDWFGGGKPALSYESPKPIRQWMSVSQAYNAIPHQQTTFSLNSAQSMSKEDAEYLQQFFKLVDAAVVERVWQMRNKAGSESNYMEILRELDQLMPPEKLKQMHSLVMHAINEQREYLEEWHKQVGKIDLYHAWVQSSHRKLPKAFQLLMDAYPNENNHNKQAFYDHLCALDFI